MDCGSVVVTVAENCGQQVGLSLVGVELCSRA